MRVSRIEFKGFRRLAATATNFDGPLTAFVGFNEAGKTTILHALAWFTEGGAISPIDYNRSRQPTSDDTPIVKVYFELDDSDRESFAHIAMDNRPTTLVLNRNRDGERYRKLMPGPRDQQSHLRRRRNVLRRASRGSRTSSLKWP